ncbi:MAG: cyclase family protein [Rubrobacteraceae bacterium]|nr:cyclase family protein [Rubrobacteraceae bacterium]
MRGDGIERQPARSDAEETAARIHTAAERYRNWGRWGEDDVRGTLNFIDDAMRAHAATLVRHGRVFSLAMKFDSTGPQKGIMGRGNPVHTMRETGDDAVHMRQGFPHGIGGADDVIFMPLQSATHWDGLGHIFDRGLAYNGRPADEVVVPAGDLVTGIENVSADIVGRGVLLDFGRAIGDGELPDGYAITEDHIQQTIEKQGPTSVIGRGDLVLARTGQLSRCYREGWGGYAGGDAPGFSFSTAGWLHRTEIAAVATDTWGFEVRPYEFEGVFSPLHQVAIPNMGLTIGEMFDLEALAEDCARDGVYEFLLVAGPLPVTGAVGAPVNPIAVK